MAEKKRPIGRPSKYDPKYCQEIIDFMSDGSSIIAFAAHIEVDDSTLYEWKKVHPDFSRAIKTAMHKSQAWWERQGRSGLFTHNKESFSQSVWIFNMKARFGYRDSQEIEMNHSGKLDLNYNLEYDPNNIKKPEAEDESC